MATVLSGQITAQDTPAIVFTAYADFWLQIDIVAGSNVVALQADIADNSTWQNYLTYSADGVDVVPLPASGGAMKFRLVATTFATGPINWVVRGKLNANDTIGGFAPGFVELDESGDQAIEEDATSIEYEEAA